MPVITLPDGSQKAFDKPVTVFDVAQSIGAGLAKGALAGKVNTQLVDLSYLIEDDATLDILTEKHSEGLSVLRHSCAHLLAQAVQSVYPDAQVTIGPVIEGCVFFFLPQHRTLPPNPAQICNNKMLEIVKQNLT